MRRHGPFRLMFFTALTEQFHVSQLDDLQVATTYNRMYGDHNDHTVLSNRGDLMPLYHLEDADQM